MHDASIAPDDNAMNEAKAPGICTPHGTVRIAMEAILVAYFQQQASEVSALLRAKAAETKIATLTRERDALKTQLAAARELMAEAATDIKYMVNAEYHGPDDVHPAMRAKYTRDMEIVSRLTAALTQRDAATTEREGGV
jgi:hypothetical protein